MKVSELKDSLLEFTPTAIAELKNIITSSKSSSKVKLDAITALFDRVGMPALRATISRTLTGTPDFGQLLEDKDRLALETAKLDSDLLEVKTKLGKANSS